MEWFFGNVVFYVVIAAIVLLAAIKFLDLFRWNPWVYLIGGALVVVLAVALALHSESENAGRREAAAGAPPPPVAVGAFDAERDANAADEVALVGTLRLDLAETWEEELAVVSVPVRRWAAPLEPAGGFDDGVIRVVVVEPRRRDADLDAWIARDGLGSAATPVRGYIVRAGFRESRAHLAERFAARGLTLADDAVLIDPFLRSRAEELAPRDTLVMAGSIGLFGLAVFGYGLLRRWLRRRPHGARATP